MEVPLPLQRSLSCGIASSQSTHIRIKPFLGILPNGTTQWRTGHMAAKVTYQINASADFSRRRPRKSSTPSSKDSTPRGFGPRTQVPTSTQKKDRKNSEEKEGPGTSSQKEIGSLSADTSDMKIRSGEEETTNISLVPEVDEDGDGESNDEHDVVGLEVPSTHVAFSVSKVSQFEESVQIPDVNKHVIESKDEGISNSEEKLAATGGVDNSYTSTSELKRKEDEFLKLKLESEESLRKETINKLADANFRKGNKLFYYPELVKPNQHIEIFFNRSFSTLKNEPDVMITGAFNDWKWKSFGMKLSKSHLKGDWWSCQFYVPKEAYKIDFVFYNGQDVYENNDEQDFCIAVEGGMDVFDFENFLLEEKMREQEDLLRQNAEREKQEEEQRYIEAEKAAIEADRAQAKEETAKTRGMMQVVMKKALISVDDAWYIEPKPWDVEGSGMVRLYYNRSSGPLSHAKDLWIHGGYNNWKDGLSIVSKLIKSGKDGDWWFADGMQLITSKYQSYNVLGLYI